MATFIERAASAYNAFTGQDPLKRQEARGSEITYVGASSTPFAFTSLATERNIVSAIYTQLMIDVAAVFIRHVKVDENDNFQEVVNSGLNNCLNLEANIDQAATAFRMDIASTLFHHGVAAVVPVDTDLNPDLTGSYTIHTMRVGHIVTWHPRHVTVSLYNDRTGKREELYLSKTIVAIIQNPLYNVMNEPNGTLKRLIQKLALLDATEAQGASGKLDILIQLPYTVKTDEKKRQAEVRRKDIEMQLTGSKYGIGYIDSTEKVTQLNRPAENNLLAHVESLTAKLYSELGLTVDVFNGTADEKTMLNYYNRTINPITRAISEEFKRKFLTKTAVTQGHSIQSYRDPFLNVSMETLAELADKLSRNEIMTSNEWRGKLGMKPSKDPGADDLRNKNLNIESTSEVKKAPLQGKFEKITEPTAELTP